jgi:hypothetical protein
MTEPRDFTSFNTKGFVDLLALEKSSDTVAQVAAKLVQADPKNVQKREQARKAQQLWHDSHFGRLSKQF